MFSGEAVSVSKSEAPAEWVNFNSFLGIENENIRYYILNPPPLVVILVGDGVKVTFFTNSIYESLGEVMNFVAFPYIELVASTLAAMLFWNAYNMEEEGLSFSLYTIRIVLNVGTIIYGNDILNLNDFMLTDAPILSSVSAPLSILKCPTFPVVLYKGIVVMWNGYTSFDIELLELVICAAFI